MRKIIASALGLALAITMISCGGDGFKTTESGLKYKFIEQSDTGRLPQEGDLIEFEVIAKTPDSTFINSYQSGRPFRNPVLKPTYTGCINEGFMMMRGGDSAVFIVNGDSLFKKTFALPEIPEFAKGKEVTLTFRMVKVYSKEEVQAQIQEQRESEQQRKEAMAQMSAEELAKVDEFIASKGWTVEKTASGLRYMKISGKGTVAAQAEKTVVCHYTGTLMDGKKFDSSLDRGEPFQFTLGIGQVIPGWDEGISLMKKGEKFRFIIPSYLGYGANPAGEIPPNSTLIFEVELLDVL